MVSAVGSERALRALAAAGAALVISTFGGRALADPSAADKASAEVLFNDAQRLVKEGKFAEACPKYAESLRLDTGIGTMLYLADCYEKNGQTASAWGQFREAASVAKNANQSDREKKATERAAALEPRLARLSITVAPEAALPGIEVKRDGEVIGKAIWGTAMPLDPGDHVVEAIAPGKKRWSSTVKLVDGAAAPVTVQVPALEVDPDANKPKLDASKVEPPKVEPPKVEPPTSFDLIPIVSLSAAGLGVISLGVGGALGGVAISKNTATQGQCKPNNTCSPTGTAGRTSALGYAAASTGTIVVGGILVAGGVATFLINKVMRSPEKKALSAAPLIGARAGGLMLSGVW